MAYGMVSIFQEVMTAWIGSLCPLLRAGHRLPYQIWSSYNSVWPLAHAAVEDEVEGGVEDKEEVVEVAEAEPRARKAQALPAGEFYISLVNGHPMFKELIFNYNPFIL